MKPDEIHNAIVARQASMNERATAREIGISPTTLIKAKRGDALDYKTTAKICSWLGVEISVPLPILFSAGVPKVSGDLAFHIIKANETFIRNVDSVGHL